MEVRASDYTKLGIRVEDLNLTRRTANCLRHSKIAFLGEIIRHEKGYFLSLRNFGLRSLNDLEEMLYRLGLTFGMSFDNRLMRPVQSAKGNVIKEDQPQRPPRFLVPNTPEAYERLGFLIKDMALTARTLNCLQHKNLITIADLIEKDESYFLGLKNFGRKSLDDLKNMLASLNLGFNMTFDHQKLESLSNRRTAILSNHDKYLARICGALGKFTDRRLKTIISSRIARNEGQTLAETADQLGVTRERARQLEKRIFAKIRTLLSGDELAYLKLLGSWICKAGIVSYKIDEAPADSWKFRFLESLIKVESGTEVFHDSMSQTFLTSKLAGQIEILIRQNHIKGKTYTKDEIRKGIAVDFEKIVPPDSLSLLEDYLIQKYAKNVPGGYVFGSIEAPALLANIIKETFPAGIALYKDAHKLKEKLHRLGFASLAKRKTRNICANALRSADLVLWDWGVYRHKDNIQIDTALMAKCAQWLEEKLKFVRKVSMYGAFQAFERECRENGIENEHALYSCMRLTYSDRYNFRKDPHVEMPGMNGHQNNASIIENYIRDCKRPVSRDEIVEKFCLKPYQYAMRVAEFRNVVRGKFDVFTYYELTRHRKKRLAKVFLHITRTADRWKHIDIRPIYEKYIRPCKIVGISDPVMLYDLASRVLSPRITFSRYPYAKIGPN